MNFTNIKYQMYKIIHDYPVEIWTMWSIIIIFIIGIIVKIYYKLTDYSATYQFIMNL